MVKKKYTENWRLSNMNPLKPVVKSGSPDGWAVSVSLVTQTSIDMEMGLKQFKTSFQNLKM